MNEFDVHCTTAAGEDVGVVVQAVDAEDALRQVQEHVRIFYGPGDAAGRWLAWKNPNTLVAVHGVVRLGEKHPTVREPVKK